MRNNKKSIYLIIIFMIAIVIGVGYAYLSSNLNILGNTTINKASWDVHFENLRITDGSITATTPATIDANSTTVNFGVTLTNPGDYYEFTVDEVNKGTIDAMVSSLIKTGLTEEQAKYLDYSVTYDSGTIVSEKQLLAANKKETIKVRVEFKKDLIAADLPQVETTLNLTFSLNYIQADDSAVAITHPVCKRATTLHTEVCNQTDTTGCKSNSATSSIVTYGNLGTAGTLASGDAFDCDVNGDGTYDPLTERFYYATDLDIDSKYAVLIYYSNVSRGVADNNATPYAYNTLTDSKATEYEGPIVVKDQLPTTEQWSNVSLSSVKRNILDESGTERVLDFAYAGSAARLLTYQEVNRACNNSLGARGGSAGALDGCQYLMENTEFSNNSLLAGYWLESVHSSYAYGTWYVNSAGRRVFSYFGGSAIYSGVRPAIEVQKNKISY